MRYVNLIFYRTQRCVMNEIKAHLKRYRFRSHNPYRFVRHFGSYNPRGAGNELFPRPPRLLLWLGDGQHSLWNSLSNSINPYYGAYLMHPDELVWGTFIFIPSEKKIFELEDLNAWSWYKSFKFIFYILFWNSLRRRKTVRNVSYIKILFHYGVKLNHL